MVVIKDTTSREGVETIIPAWFATYIGIPFDDMNCWQLICHIYRKEFKTIIPDYRDEYDSAMDAATIHRVINREMADAGNQKSEWRRVHQPRLSDIAVFRITGLTWHTGMVAAKGEMLHTMKNMNSCMERYDGKLWEKRLLGFYRYHGAENVENAETG